MNDPFPNPRILDSHGRCACLLVIDTSGSQSGRNILAVNEGLERFVLSLMRDAKTRTCVDVGIVTFDASWRMTREFTAPSDLRAPRLMASSTKGTCLASALEAAVDLVERRTDSYLAQGFAAYRPWMLLLSDATPTDGESDRRRAASRLRRAAEDLQLVFCAVGVGHADMKLLEDLAPQGDPIALAPEALDNLFEWLTASMARISIERVQERPTAPLANARKWS